MDVLRLPWPQHWRQVRQVSKYDCVFKSFFLLFFISFVIICFNQTLHSFVSSSYVLILDLPFLDSLLLYSQSLIITLIVWLCSFFFFLFIISLIIIVLIIVFNNRPPYAKHYEVFLSKIHIYIEKKIKTWERCNCDRGEMNDATCTNSNITLLGHEYDENVDCFCLFDSGFLFFVSLISFYIIYKMITWLVFVNQPNTHHR